jgi:hypothetical protein
MLNVGLKVIQYAAGGGASLDLSFEFAATGFETASTPVSGGSAAGR